ncbi:hypothetical protein [Brevundimonas vesicularis]|uniref:hypothetical protein n=1 Tax=Brevundimonas vesicularis TaxID=41276 RepID=UPI0011BD7A17|nr:hypothetical protein [Brevundimonas vesicularis]
MKRFLMASALALSFVVSAPAVAKADPITTAIVTTFTSFAAGTTAYAVATFVVNSALYAAGSWAVTKAAKALGLMKSNVAERQASVTTLSLGETPREAVVGIACVGGSLIDAWNHGGKYGTDYVTRRVALADHVLDGLIGYYVDDTYYAFNGNGVQPGFNGALQLTFVNATRDGVFPPPYMLQAGVGLTSADRCPSVAEIWITYKFDDQVWTRGHPGLKFVVRGLRTYDPRFDPQYGYTGPSPQTWDDVSTHRFSENAAIVRYNIQRGVYAVGRHGELEHLLIGRGLTADEAPAARIIAAANVCDEIVDGRPRYTVGGAISSAQAHIEVEEMFAAATAGQIVQRDGGVEVEPGQAKAAVVTITDADLVAGEAISFDEFTPDTDGGRINTVIARYVEPSQLYKDHSGAVLRNQADIIEDGGPRELTLPLMLVTNKGQADRCAEISRRGARLERRARIALVPMLLAGRASAELEDGDIIAWQSNRYHEGATVRYRIEAYGVDEGWRNTLQLREMASSVFGQADPVEDRAAPPPAPTPIDALQLVGVQAEAITLPGETSTLPAVRFSWNVTTDDTAMTAIRAEVRRVGETDAAPTRIDDVAKGQANVTNGVGPDQALECRLVPIGDPSRPVLASNWITVSTSTIVAGDLSPESPVWTEIELQGVAIDEVTGRLVGVEGITETLQQGVSDLEEVYGDTANSAANATAAAEDAAKAILARAGAVAAEAGAIAAKNDAVTAAGASASSASQAGGFKTAAETASAAATVQQVAATTARNGAVAAAIVGFPDIITADLFTEGVTDRVAPDSRPSVTGSRVASGAYTTPVGDAVSFSPKAFVKWSQGKVIEISVTMEGVSGSAAAYARLAARRMTSGYVTQSTVYQPVTIIPVGGEVVLTYIVGFGVTPAGGVQLPAATGAEWVAIFDQTNLNASASAAVAGAQQRIKRLTVRDVTSQIAAQGAASASASSAANAAVSEAASGQNALASQTARTAAETAKGQAESFRNEAASSRDTATEQAALATTQAGLSAGSANQAGQKADAASGSASQASTKADEAGASAAASLANQVSAGVARDQAVAALMAQGRQNLVARENVTTGQLVTLPSGGTSGWGFSMVGAGANITRSIKVGPLKVSTPYSLSFKARRTSGSGSLSINVDLYPDTLPERTFDIQSSAWTEYKWENITSSSGDMTLATAQLRFFRSTLPAGYSYEITDIKLEEGATATAWTPSPKDAAFSASASATSAASAAASDTAAGQKAAAAEGFATTAATKAGEAQTYRNQSASSASDAAGYSLEAQAASGTSVAAKDESVASKLAAQAAAATAIEQKSEATAAAAAASISAELAASTAALRGNLLKNGGMERGLEGISGPNLYVSNDSWGPAVRVAPAGNGTYGVDWAPVDIFGGATYTVSGDALLFADSGSRYFDMIWLNASGGIVGDSGQKPMGPGDYSNDRARINAMAWTEQAPANATRVVVRAIFEGVVNPTAMGARRVKLEFGEGPATAYTPDAAVGALAAKLDITAAVAADAQTRLANVIFEVIGASGGDPFQLLFKTIGSSSIGQMVASALRFGNVIGGQIVDTMKLIGGEVFIVGPLYLGPNKEIELNPLSSNPHISIKVGGGRMAFGKLPNDNLIYWFGPSQTVAAMRKNNATEWRDTLGNAYFGGSLAAGQLIARDRTSSLSVSASVDTGRYGSNGGAITVTASLSGGWGKTYYSASNLAAASESGTIVVSLDRAINGGAFSNGVATMSRAYTWSRENQGFEPGQGYLIVENGSYGGAITYTDPQQVAQDRQYRARITNFSPITLAGPPTVQDLSVISVE